MAIILYKTVEIGFYMPLLFLIAIPTGVFIGFTSNRVLKIVKDTVHV